MGRASYAWRALVKGRWRERTAQAITVFFLASDLVLERVVS